MDTQNHDKQLIADLGGAAAVARLLGFGQFGIQRVHNWTTRGIPAHIKVKHPDLFLYTRLAPTQDVSRLEKTTA